MRIALYHNLPSGGAKRHTYEQVRELARRGHEIVEFAPSTANIDFCSFEPFIHGRHIFPLSPVAQMQRRIPLVTPYIHAAQGINTLRRTDNVNQIIATEIDKGGFSLALVKDCHITMNPSVLRHLHTPTMFQCHHALRHRVERAGASTNSNSRSLTRVLKTFYYVPAQAWYQRVFAENERTNARSAACVITNSVFSKQLLLQVYGVDSEVVYPGIDTKLFSPQPVPHQDYVLSVGALIYSKGHRFLISALGEIPETRRPKLFIAANSRDDKEEAVVRQMAAAAGVQIHVERITNDRRLVQVYNEALVFVYAPIQEALGMAPLEALACGTPVVAVGEGGVGETVQDGVTGWLVERNIKEFADRLEVLLHNESLRNQMGAAGAAHVRQNWTWQKAVDQLEWQLQQVMANNRVS
jgi:glycosyltransferase involved in cell wall biosynthesis